MSKIKSFLDMLFDDGDKVFVGPNLYSGSVLSKEEVSSGQFFCINACEGGRKKENITKFRNFLIEIDKDPETNEPMDRRAQGILIAKHYQMPYSTVVSSGNKSIHFILSLEEPLDNLDEYDFFAKYIKNIIKEADPSVLVPEKLSRFVEGVNDKTNNQQIGMVSKFGRVSNERFKEWLSKYPDKRPDLAPKQTPIPNQNGGTRDGVVQIVRWYITEYLRQPYNNIRGHYQCPVCAVEGGDTSKNNLYVSGPKMQFHCFAVKEHNQLIFREMRSLHYHVKRNE